ncbi:MAG: AraC family transcriptional regulator [Bacteroidota bacterium]
MKPIFEALSLAQKQCSFGASQIEAEHFEPFWHFHPEVELTWIIQGEGTRFVGDSILPYGPGDLVLVGSNVPHQWVSSQAQLSSQQEALVIQFPEDLFAAFPECEAINKLFQEAKRGLYFSSPQQAIKEKLSTFVSFNPAQQLSQLLQILLLLTEYNLPQMLSQRSQFQTQGKAADSQRINSCIDFILSQLKQPLSVNLMADRLHMVPQSFCRWFKQQTGTSFITFVNQSRIQSACQYLLNTDLPIQSIAFEVGFENVSHFNRTFKKLQGVSPGVYRRGG